MVPAPAGVSEVNISLKRVSNILPDSCAPKFPVRTSETSELNIDGVVSEGGELLRTEPKSDVDAASLGMFIRVSRRSSGELPMNASTGECLMSSDESVSTGALFDVLYIDAKYAKLPWAYGV